MSFAQGLSGLNAASKNLDAIGNNVANANTVGFKGSKAIFADVYANSLGGTGGATTGIGVRVSSVTTLFSQGNINVTSNPFDIAINGGGFFRLDDEGAISYSRNGQFHLDKDGFVVNDGGAKLTGYGVNAAGAVVASSAMPLQVSTADISPKVTTKADVVVNLDARDPIITNPFDITDASTYNRATSVTVFDTLGNPHTLASYFVKTAANEWDVQAAMDGVGLAAPFGPLEFNSDGTLDVTGSALPYAVSVAVTTGATSPLVFELDFTNSTQFGSSFGVNKLVQDGYTSGKLAGYNVSDDGTVLGRYSNGESRTLGQLVLAGFANPQGLQPLGGNAFVETASSGQPLLGSPGNGNLGAVSSGAVEESNVDLTKELVDMITAQRVYQANAQTIKTQDQVLNTLVNLR